MSRTFAVLLAVTLFFLSCGKARIRHLETGLKSCQEELYQIQASLHRHEGRISGTEQRVQELMQPEAEPPEGTSVSEGLEEKLRRASEAGDWGQVLRLAQEPLAVLKTWPGAAVLFYAARGLEETGHLQEASAHYQLLQALWPLSPHGAEALWRWAALCRARGALDCERLVLHNLLSLYPGSRWEKDASRRLVALRKANRR